MGLGRFIAAMTITVIAVAVIDGGAIKGNVMGMTASRAIGATRRSRTAARVTAALEARGASAIGRAITSGAAIIVIVRTGAANRSPTARGST